MKIKHTSVRGGAGARAGLRPRAGANTPAPDPERIRRAVREIATLPGRMGLGAFADDEGELEVVTEPQAVAVADVLLAVMDDPEEAEVLRPVRPALEQLALRMEQHGQVQDNARAAAKLDGDLRDTDRWASAREKELQDELYGLLDDLLDPQRGGLSQTERDRLETDASEILALRAEERAGRLAERTLTLEEAAAHRAALEAADEEEHLASVKEDLRQRRPVDAAALSQAVETFRALRAAPPPSPGRRSRPR